MDEQKPLENKQGEPGEKTEKSEYSFMQETIKDENSRGKKCRKDLLRMAGLGVVFGVVFLRSNHGLIRSFPEIHKR